MQPRERRQFLVSVGRQNRCRGGSVPDCCVMLLLLLQMVVTTAAGASAAAVTVVTMATVTVAAGDDHVVVDDVVFGFDVHLFGREQDNVANTVHALRRGYIILAEMSLLQ